MRWKLERDTLSTPLVTKSLQANLSLIQASVAHLKAVVERQSESKGGVGESRRGGG